MITLEQLRRSPQVASDLDWIFDCALARGGDHDWICLEGDVPLVDFAGSASGDGFILYGDGDPATLPVMLVTSEGQAGRIAANLTELLALFVALPCWRDLPRYAGRIEEMRRAEESLSRRKADDYGEDLPRVLARLRAALPIPDLADPIQTFRDQLLATDCRCVAKDGSVYEPLHGDRVYKEAPPRQPQGTLSRGTPSQTTQPVATAPEPFVRPTFPRDLSPLAEHERERIRRLLMPPDWSDDGRLLLWINRTEREDEDGVMMWSPTKQSEWIEATRFFEAANRRIWRTPEELDAVLAEPGPWFVRWNHSGTFWFVNTTDEDALFGPGDQDVLTADPAEAAEMSSDLARRVILSLSKDYELDESSTIYFEPVRPADPRHDVRFDPPAK